jgi:hypothetical protein
LITVTVSPQQGSQTIVRRPIVRGLSTDLTAQVLPETVEMTLVGPLPRLEALEEQEVFIYADVVDMGVGQHDIELTYLVPEGLEVSSLLPPSVDVIISRMTPTPTATSTHTPTPTPTLTVSLSGTLTSTMGLTVTLTPVLSATPPITMTPPITATPVLTGFVPTITVTLTPTTGAAGGG